jgi:hypothetical protein
VTWVILFAFFLLLSLFIDTPTDAGITAGGRPLGMPRLWWMVWSKN